MYCPEKALCQRHQGVAYADTNIPLGDGQFMLPPRSLHVLCGTCPQASGPSLEVGTGSGYMTAALAGPTCCERRDVLRLHSQAVSRFKSMASVMYL